MSTLNYIKLGLALTVLVVFGLATTVSARVEYTITPIALGGQQAPNQPGAFTSFSYPVLNSQGRIAFGASYEGGSGIYYTGEGIVYCVADLSMRLPQDPCTAFYNFGSPILNDNGTVVFNANSGSLGQGAYRGCPCPLIRIASGSTWNDLGTPVPDHPGYYFNWVVAKSINDSDVVALLGQALGAGVTGGVYAGTGSGLTKIAENGTPVPGQPIATFNGSFQLVAINSPGDVAFHAYYTDGQGTQGLYIYTSGTLQRIADGTTVAPPQTDPIEGLFKPSLNADGQVAFQAHSDTDPFYRGNYLWTAGQLEVLADTNSGHCGFGYPRINDNGVAAFKGTCGGQHIMRVDSSVSEFVATAGYSVPCRPDAGFTLFIDPSINANNAVVFRAFWHSPTSGYGVGIYTDVGGYLVKVVDTEDILVDGLSASDLDMEDRVNLGGRSPFNDSGQVAFWAKLSDGRQGVFLADPVYARDYGDLDGNGRVDFTDFAIFASYWHATDCNFLQNGWCQGADCEPDGDIDFNDLAEFVKHWLDGTTP